jgi:hypothetical protein
MRAGVVMKAARHVGVMALASSLAAAPALAGPTLALRAGYAPGYDYPTAQSGQRVVPFPSASPALGLELSAGLQGRLEFLAGARYLRSSGLDGLMKIPEAPDLRVTTTAVALLAGVRCSVPGLTGPLRLYADLAPALVLFRTSVVNEANWLGLPRDQRSESELVPGVIAGAAAAVPFASRWALEMGLSYLATGRIENRDHLITRSAFRGMRSITLTGGVRFHVW